MKMFVYKKVFFDEKKTLPKFESYRVDHTAYLVQFFLKISDSFQKYYVTYIFKYLSINIQINTLQN